MSLLLVFGSQLRFAVPGAGSVTCKPGKQYVIPIRAESRERSGGTCFSADRGAQVRSIWR